MRGRQPASFGRLGGFVIGPLLPLQREFRPNSVHLSEDLRLRRVRPQPTRRTRATRIASYWFPPRAWPTPRRARAELRSRRACASSNCPRSRIAAGRARVFAAISRKLSKSAQFLLDDQNKPGG